MTANKMPEDSVLRRHYETHLKMMGSAGSTSSSHSASRPTTTASMQDSSRGGFMRWLKRLFGG